MNERGFIVREEKKKDNTNEKKGVSFEALSSLDAPVSFWKGIPFGLQYSITAIGSLTGDLCR